MEVSSAFAPSVHTPGLIADAERLGYFAAWCNDSPAIYDDTWMTLASAAARTRVIRLGAAVSVPSLRHVMSMASAISTLDAMARGRVRVALGTGLTARLTLGKRPQPWSAVQSYVQTLQGLLAGERLEFDGAEIQRIDADASLVERVQLWIAADGPRGFEVAEVRNAGVMSTGRLSPDALRRPNRALLTFGTILREGETWDSPRVRGAAGPAVAAAIHAMHARGRDIRHIPGASAWLDALDGIDPSVQHLETHRGHLRYLNNLDLLGWPEAAELIPKFTLSGLPEDVLTRIRRIEDSGVTELIYQPIGEDLGDELVEFARLTGLRPGEAPA